MRTRTAAHIYAIGDVVSLDVHEGGTAKLNPFTVEARMPPVGASLQYRVKSGVETCRRVVAEHQLSAFGREAAALPATIAPSDFDESD